MIQVGRSHTVRRQLSFGNPLASAPKRQRLSWSEFVWREGFEASLELRDGGGTCLGNIVVFLGVIVLIVELHLAVAPPRESPPGGADALAIEFGSSRDERESNLFDADSGAVQN
jgi:hypothetical protein